MWLNILWPNVIVKSSISERRQWCFEQPGGLSSDSISFAAIISHKMKKWSSAEIWLLLKNHPQLWGLGLALPSICRLVCTIGKKGASHPIWPVPADHKLCRSRRHSIRRYHTSWWMLRVLNMATCYTLKLQDLNVILRITAVPFPVPVGIKDHTWRENY